MDHSWSTKGPYTSAQDGDASYTYRERQGGSNIKINIHKSVQLLDEAVGVSPSSPASCTRSVRHHSVLQPKASSSLIEPSSRRLFRDDITYGGRLETTMSPALPLRSALPQASRNTLPPSAYTAIDDDERNLSMTFNGRDRLLAEITSGLDESQLTSTNVALLLSEGSTDLANLSGVYADFEVAVKRHPADNQAFDLVGAFIHILEDQTSVLGKLIDKVAGSQQRFSQVYVTYNLLCNELWTWRLVDSLYRDIIETEIKEAMAGSSLSDGDEAMTVDNAASPMHANGGGESVTQQSEVQLVDALYEQCSDTRRRQIVVDWLEMQAEHRLAGIHSKEQFYRDSSAAAWENTLHLLKKTKDAGSYGTKGGTHNLVTEVDPDAPHRQGKQLYSLDKEDEVRFLKHVFAEIRAGKLEEAEELCVRCGQAWRAASLEGWRLYHDPNFTVTSASANEELVHDIQGNWHRDVWKSACWSIAEQEHISASERAIYATMSGNLRGMLPMCESWEDYLWAHLRASVDLQVEQHVRLSTANAAAADRTLASLPDEYWNRDISLDKIFQEIESRCDDRTRTESQTYYHLMQKHMILDDVKGLLSVMGRKVQTDIAFLPAHVLRFMAHIVLFVKKIGRPSAIRATDGDAVLAAYVHQLVADKRQCLVATYTALLPPNQQVATYAAFLEGITERKTRMQCLKLASDCGLDTCSITKKVVENIFAKSSARLDVANNKGPSTTDFSATEADSVCIDALDWLTFEPSQRVEAILKANYIMRIFIAMGKLAAARDAFSRVPTDSVDYVTRQQSESPAIVTNSAVNAIKEYRCIKAYLDAQDAFNDWFQHFHHKKPLPMQKDMSRGAGFAERVAQEQRAKLYESELQQWKAASLRQAKATTEKLYNVLLFPDGGWMVDSFVEDDAVDTRDGPDKDTSHDCGRSEQLLSLRRLCLPLITTLLASVLTATGQHIECLRLADLVASEQHRLYEAFSRDDVRRLLANLRDASLALLDSSYDPLGYSNAGSAAVNV